MPLSTLDGLKVLDFGHYFAGPYASRLLADLGAEVIKLEPLDGDLLRPTVKPFNGAQRGKRCIAVDLKHPRGNEIGRRMAAWADVVSHNLRPGVAERLSLDYASVRATNPTVIYDYAPGWGSSGPDASLPGFAPLFAGYVGLHHEAAGEGNTPVAPVGNEDNGNGLLGATAILMALYHRKRTGEGQYLEHPQLNATLLMAGHLMRRPDGSVVGSAHLDHERRGGHPLDRLYRTADGWLCLSARTDAEFARLGGVPGFGAIVAGRALRGRRGADVRCGRAGRRDRFGARRLARVGLGHDAGRARRAVRHPDRARGGAARARRSRAPRRRAGRAVRAPPLGHHEGHRRARPPEQRHVAARPTRARAGRAHARAARGVRLPGRRDRRPLRAAHRQVMAGGLA